MTRLLLLSVLSLAAASCARNKSSDEPGTRIRDTTMTAKDTTNPNDTLPHIRDSVPDATHTDSSRHLPFDRGPAYRDAGLGGGGRSGRRRTLSKVTALLERRLPRAP